MKDHTIRTDIERLGPRAVAESAVPPVPPANTVLLADSLIAREDVVSQGAELLNPLSDSHEHFGKVRNNNAGLNVAPEHHVPAERPQHYQLPASATAGGEGSETPQQTHETHFGAVALEPLDAGGVAVASPVGMPQTLPDAPLDTLLSPVNVSGQAPQSPDAAKSTRQPSSPR